MAICHTAALTIVKTKMICYTFYIILKIIIIVVLPQRFLLLEGERMHTTDFHQNFNLFFDEFRVSRKHGKRTEKLAPHQEIGEGTIFRFIPRMDLEVVISEYKLYRAYKMRMSTKRPMIELSYCFQGLREANVSGNQHELASGSCTLQLMKEVNAHFEFKESQPYMMMGIAIPVSTFDYFMEEVSGVHTRSIDFAQILGKKSYRMFKEKIDPAASVIAKQICQSVKTGSMKNLELECSALQLLSMAFRSFLFDSEPEPARFSKRDVGKIRQARDIIVEHMTEPPTLLELARWIDLNDYKLKKGFKEMYGTTVFGYLREKRLEKAFLLLQNGKMNVNEVSCAVGYSNPSYFAEAFRTKYGINPGELIRRSF